MEIHCQVSKQVPNNSIAENFPRCYSTFSRDFCTDFFQQLLQLILQRFLQEFFQKNPIWLLKKSVKVSLGNPMRIRQGVVTTTFFSSTHFHMNFFIIPLLTRLSVLGWYTSKDILNKKRLKRPPIKKYTFLRLARCIQIIDADSYSSLLGCQFSQC